MPREETTTATRSGSADLTRMAPPSPMVRGSDSGVTQEEKELAEWIKEVMGKGRLTALGLASRSATDASLSPIRSWDQEDFDKHDPDDLAAHVMVEAYRD